MLRGVRIAVLLIAHAIMLNILIAYAILCVTIPLKIAMLENIWSGSDT